MVTCLPVQRSMQVRVATGGFSIGVAPMATTASATTTTARVILGLVMRTAPSGFPTRPVNLRRTHPGGYGNRRRTGPSPDPPRARQGQAFADAAISASREPTCDAAPESYVPPVQP